MKSENEPQQADKEGVSRPVVLTLPKMQNLSNSIGLKFAVIVFLMLLMYIPSLIVIDLMMDRKELRGVVVAEVSSQWGPYQYIQGPIISVPYQYNVQVKQGGQLTSEVKSGFIHFLPDELGADFNCSPLEKSRGIFKVLLYEGEVKLSGKFGLFNDSLVNVPKESLRWDKAVLFMGMPGLKGIKGRVYTEINGKQFEMSPGLPHKLVVSDGISTPVNLSSLKDGFAFSLGVSLRGSTGLEILPVGKTTIAKGNSNWPRPNFSGEFLPDSSTVNDNGFSANWNVSYLNRSFPQVWADGEYFIGATKGKYPIQFTESERPEVVPENGSVVNAGFNVNLLPPLDHYAKSLRSAKYSYFIIGLTFITFFFVEVLNRRRIHPMQYLLVGATIPLFYLLLLSLSEIIGFPMGYLVSMLLVVGLATFYFHYVFSTGKQVILMSLMMFGLYGYFYALLELQDYSLLMGSLMLLLVLGAIMYFSRKVDWYNVGQEK